MHYGGFAGLHGSGCCKTYTNKHLVEPIKGKKNISSAGWKRFIDHMVESGRQIVRSSHNEEDGNKSASPNPLLTTTRKIMFNNVAMALQITV